MFTSARLKLTFWYLLIIMGISVSFSIFVYRQVTQEVKRGLRLHILRSFPKKNLNVVPQNFLQEIPPEFTLTDTRIYEEIRDRIVLQLVLVNLGIVSVSGIAGFFLAGKTLHPIELMVEEQKRFIADASHELRTPLTTMKTEIEVALQNKTIEGTEAKKILESNLEEIDRMQKLATHLLTLSRFENDSQEMVTEEVNSNDLLAIALSRTQQLAKEKAITIETSKKNVLIIGDSVRLIELLTIFLDNAIKYSGNQGKIIIHFKKTRDSLYITVKDYGIGITSSELPHIFNRFYRADLSRSKTRVEGYGLGLSIAKVIVDLHQGKIDVQSEPGKGTTVSVRLPQRYKKSLSLFSGTSL